jgi:hypothetical protein
VHLHFADRSPRPLFITGGPLPEGAAAILGTTSNGACVFHEGVRCRIHLDLGPEVLPSACREFPRMTVRDPRRTSITLSHFCPTAARLLLGEEGLDIVEAPESISLNGQLDGLDARDALPPLLRPGLLCDLDGYAEWERRALNFLERSSGTTDDAIARIAAATRVLEDWTPARGSLADAVKRAFDIGEDVDAESSVDGDAQRYIIALSAVPDGLTANPPPDRLDEGWRRASEWLPRFDRAMRRFVGAHLFASWIAYYAVSLSTVVESLRVALAVLRVEAARQTQSSVDAAGEQGFIEAVRRADLLLVHLADARKLTKAVETSAEIRPRASRKARER